METVDNIIPSSPTNGGPSSSFFNGGCPSSLSLFPPDTLVSRSSFSPSKTNNAVHSFGSTVTKDDVITKQLFVSPVRTLNTKNNLTEIMTTETNRSLTATAVSDEKAGATFVPVKTTDTETVHNTVTLPDIRSSLSVASSIVSPVGNLSLQGNENVTSSLPTVVTPAVIAADSENLSSVTHGTVGNYRSSFLNHIGSTANTAIDGSLRLPTLTIPLPTDDNIMVSLSSASSSSSSGTVVSPTSITETLFTDDTTTDDDTGQDTTVNGMGNPPPPNTETVGPNLLRSMNNSTTMNTNSTVEDYSLSPISLMIVPPPVNPPPSSSSSSSSTDTALLDTAVTSPADSKTRTIFIFKRRGRGKRRRIRIPLEIPHDADEETVAQYKRVAMVRATNSSRSGSRNNDSIDDDDDDAVDDDHDDDNMDEEEDDTGIDGFPADTGTVRGSSSSSSSRRTGGNGKRSTTTEMTTTGTIETNDTDGTESTNPVSLAIQPPVMFIDTPRSRTTTSTALRYKSSTPTSPSSIGMSTPTHKTATKSTSNGTLSSSSKSIHSSTGPLSTKSVSTKKESALSTSASTVVNRTSSSSNSSTSKMNGNRNPSASGEPSNIVSPRTTSRNSNGTGKGGTPGNNPSRSLSRQSSIGSTYSTTNDQEYTTNPPFHSHTSLSVSPVEGYGYYSHHPNQENYPAIVTLNGTHTVYDSTVTYGNHIHGYGTPVLTPTFTTNSFNGNSKSSNKRSRPVSNRNTFTPSFSYYTSISPQNMGGYNDYGNYSSHVSNTSTPMNTNSAYYYTSTVHDASASNGSFTYPLTGTYYGTTMDTTNTTVNNTTDNTNNTNNPSYEGYYTTGTTPSSVAMGVNYYATYDPNTTASMVHTPVNTHEQDGNENQEHYHQDYTPMNPPTTTDTMTNENTIADDTNNASWAALLALSTVTENDPSTHGTISKSVDNNGTPDQYADNHDSTTYPESEAAVNYVTSHTVPYAAYPYYSTSTSFDTENVGTGSGAGNSGSSISNGQTTVSSYYPQISSAYPAVTSSLNHTTVYYSGTHYPSLPSSSSSSTVTANPLPLGSSPGVTTLKTTHLYPKSNNSNVPAYHPQKLTSSTKTNRPSGTSIPYSTVAPKSGTPTTTTVTVNSSSAGSSALTPSSLADLYTPYVPLPLRERGTIISGVLTSQIYEYPSLSSTSSSSSSGSTAVPSSTSSTPNNSTISNGTPSGQTSALSSTANPAQQHIIVGPEPFIPVHYRK